MSAFGTYAHAVSATLLDASTGADLLDVSRARVEQPADVLSDAEDRPLGHRQSRRLGQPRGRVVTLTIDSHGADFALVRDALDAARGCGLIEFRAPGDDDPSLWFPAGDGAERGLPATRPALAAAAFELRLEEHPHA